MDNLDEKIMYLRKERGLSQEELGLEIGVSRQTVSKWELGTAIPDFKNLVALSQFFNVDINYFITQSDNQIVVNETAEETINEVANKHKHLIVLKIFLVITVVLTILVGALIGVFAKIVLSSTDELIEKVTFSFANVSNLDILIFFIIIFILLVSLIILFAIILYRNKKQ